MATKGDENQETQVRILFDFISQTLSILAGAGG